MSKSYCFSKPFCPCSQSAQFLSRVWAPQKELGWPEINLGALCFLERDNSEEGLPVIQGICLSSGVVSSWRERASFRHSIDGGTEQGSAAVLVFPLPCTSSSLLSAVGWRAVVDSDPICVYILPDTVTGCWVRFIKLNGSRERAIAALPPEELEETCWADYVCRALHQENQPSSPWNTSAQFGTWEKMLKISLSV